MGERASEDLVSPSCLDDKSAFEWRRLAGQVLAGRKHPLCASVNVTLQAAAERAPQSPAAPAYRLWMADNLARDRSFAAALAAYDDAVEHARSAQPLIETVDTIAAALRYKAQTAALAGEPATAIAAFRDLAAHAPDDAAASFQAGLVAENAGDPVQAADLYRLVAAKEDSARTDDPAQLARRALLRLEAPDSAFEADVDRLADRLIEALEHGDAGTLRKLVTQTHFAIGPMGGHIAFEGEDLLDLFWEDLKESRVTARRALLGSGGKRYLQTSGWRGKYYRGDLMLLLTRAPRGWQWTGLGILTPNDLWIEHWRPPKLEKNDPLPFELLAPWPAGQSFKAGGLLQYAGEQAAVIAAGLIGGAILSEIFSVSPCGFGPRGFYFHDWPTHLDDEAFAIDFTRYRQYHPYDNAAEGTPVLAARAGMVTNVQPFAQNGDSNMANLVEIAHPDPANPADTLRFTSRYLHLEGPMKIPVSVHMPVFAGNRLGTMDDTGNSTLNHLHFSIHDRHLPNPHSGGLGASVRPTPMSGVRLDDGDSGTCVRSTNIEHVGNPMIELTDFAGQNWLITPAAAAVGEAPPRNIANQKWLMVLSGVAIANLEGNSGLDWLRETVAIRPDLSGPLHFAIDKYGIPIPPGTEGSNFRSVFRVEQWAPFASLSSIFNQDQSVNSGFAVDVWRPNPFASGTNPVSNAHVDNLFAGIQVDVAVRDTDAWIYRLGYNITLLGTIDFIEIVIT
jgi:murein DD-endopeptidase MepM/ murein hydrolase activator NlpD